MEALGARISNAQPGGIMGWFGTYLNSYFTHLPTLVNPNPVSALNTMLGGIMNNGITTFNGLMTALGNSGADIPSHIVARDAVNVNSEHQVLMLQQALYTNSTTSISDRWKKITNSKANTIEFNYNLGDYIESFDLSIGGSFREYVLDQEVLYFQTMTLR